MNMNLPHDPCVKALLIIQEVSSVWFHVRVNIPSGNYKAWAIPREIILTCPASFFKLMLVLMLP